MVEHTLQTRTDEQYPLLKVSSGDGAGDAAGQPPPIAVSPGWNVTCTLKRSWLNRWPEIVTACWMTGILLGISFLVMYVLTMGAIRKQSLVIVKCNNSKPGSEVYFHQIITRGSQVPFTLYSDYLAYMALQYPFLQFNIYFLTDDSLQNNIYRGPRHAKIFHGPMFTYSLRDYLTNFERNNAVEMREFQLKHENVNITVIPLSKYMAQTPLRFKWRTIHLSYLSFYTRIFSVWQTGGIGMDLASFSKKFSNHEYVDHRVTAILQQHNEGIKPGEYMKALNIMEKEEENELVTMFYGLVNLMLNETRSFFNRTFPFNYQFSTENLPSEKPLIRTRRNKRDVTVETTTNTENSIIDIETNETIKLAPVNTTYINKTNNIYQTLAASVASSASINHTKPINTEKMHKVSDEIVSISSQKPNYNMTSKETESRSDKTSDVAKIVLFYDFSLLSDDLGSSYTFSDPIKAYVNQPIVNPDYENARKRNMRPFHVLTIGSDGLFVAASSHFHPFLGRIISAGCQRMPPKFAIQDTLLTQCSGLLKDDVYCSNIFVL